MSQRLADSKRNELIVNFMEGKEDPEYEVIPSKTTKGKYTVRKRKVNLPVEEESPAPPKEEKKEEVPVEENEEGEADPGYYFNPYNPYMFQDYQMMLNKMMVEQMKMMRREMKYATKKREKLKDKSKRIYNLLYDLAKPKEEEQDEEEVDVESDSEQPEEPEAPAVVYANPQIIFVFLS